MNIPTLIGDVLPQIIALIISPTVVIVAVVTLSTPRPVRNLLVLLFSYLVTAVSFLVIALFAAASIPSSGSAIPEWRGWLKLVVGLLFAYLAYKQVRLLMHPTGSTGPAWLKKMDTLKPIDFIGIGVILGGLNPKSLAMLVSIGADITEAKFKLAEQLLFVLCVAVISAVGLLIPLFFDLLGGKAARTSLSVIRNFMEKNNNVIMLVLFVVMAGLFISKAIPILFH